jgi:hypothetical protein
MEVTFDQAVRERVELAPRHPLLELPSVIALESSLLQMKFEVAHECSLLAPSSEIARSYLLWTTPSEVALAVRPLGLDHHALHTVSLAP